MQSPLIDTVGLFAKKETGQYIISQGVVKFEGESDLNSLLSLFYKYKPTKIFPFIGIVTWKNHWRKATESMPSYISELHFGHYRCQALDLFLSDTIFSLIQTPKLNFMISSKAMAM